tara:strand:- start:213 stop:905 length:693 start_codon:yes stop_codon:yes gene_type:complete
MKIILTVTMLFLSFSTYANENYSKRYIKKLLIENAQKSKYVSPSIALAVARVESNFRYNVISDKGAIGVMQIMPKTALLVFNVKREKLFIPEINIKLGIRFLDSLIEKYKGNIDIALSHYNGGSAVGKWPKVKIIPITYPYVLKVLKHSLKYREETSDLSKKRIFNASLKLNKNKKNISELDFLVHDIDKWLIIYNNYKVNSKKFSINKNSLKIKNMVYQGSGTNYQSFH